jgi:hypothetical protein
MRRGLRQPIADLQILLRVTSAVRRYSDQTMRSFFMSARARYSRPMRAEFDVILAFQFLESQAGVRRITSECVYTSKFVAHALLRAAFTLV